MPTDLNMPKLLPGLDDYEQHTYYLPTQLYSSFTIQNVRQISEEDVDILLCFYFNN